MPDSRDKRRWYQFSLRTLLIAMVLSTVVIQMVRLNIAAIDKSIHGGPYAAHLFFLWLWCLGGIFSLIAASIATRQKTRTLAIILLVAFLIGLALNILSTTKGRTSDFF